MVKCDGCLFVYAVGSVGSGVLRVVMSHYGYA